MKRSAKSHVSKRMNIGPRPVFKHALRAVYEGAYNVVRCEWRRSSRVYIVIIIRRPALTYRNFRAQDLVAQGWESSGVRVHEGLDLGKESFFHGVFHKVIVSIWTDYEGDSAAVYVGREGESECERGHPHRGERMLQYATFLDDGRWYEDDGLSKGMEKNTTKERKRFGWRETSLR